MGDTRFRHRSANVTFISPCPSKVTAAENLRSQFFRTVNLRSYYLCCHSKIRHRRSGQVVSRPKFYINDEFGDFNGQSANPLGQLDLKRSFLDTVLKANEDRRKVDVNDLIEKLSATQGVTEPAYHLESFVGRWKVIYAPHIRNMEGILFTRFDPIEYVLQPAGEAMRIESNVRYQLGPAQGWLNASGTIQPVDTSSVRILFSHFWTSSARPSPTTRDAPDVVATLPAQLTNAAGRLLFFEGLSVFPVRYSDSDLAVFEFPPLGTLLVISRVEEA